jgi:hypothetical protein
MVLAVVLLGNIGGDSARSLGRVVTQEGVVSTLDEEGVKLRHLLATNPQLEGSWVGSTRGEKAVGVGSNVGNEGILNPDVAEEVTFRTNWDGNLVVGGEGTNVIHTLGLHREVGMALIVLTEKTDLRLASDVHILSTFRYKVNQSS